MIINLSKKLSIFVLFFLIAGAFLAPKAHASLSNTSDTISTSRPSAAAPLSAGTAVDAVQAQITDNGSIFLASDSAVIYPEAGESLDTGKNIASMSALGVPSAGKRTVYFGGPCAAGPGYLGCLHASTHHIGEALIVNITAVHTISFGTTAIPSGGTIILTFPGTAGAANNVASPSATGFSFNGLVASQVTFGGTAAAGCGTAQITVTAPTITCTANATITAGTVTITIGSVPTLINPTASATQCTTSLCTADLWKLQLQTSNGDSEKITIGTIQSVQVQAIVDPTLTFTIAPLNSTTNALNTVGSGNTAYNSGNCTTEADTPNSGVASTANTINLGLLNNGAINLSAQLITISTNGGHGYSLTATSSGHFTDPTTGFSIRDSSTPVQIALGAPWFGIHPCGLDVATATWGTGGVVGSANNKVAWPTVSTPLTIASNGVGPIGVSGSTAGITAVEYQAAVDVSVPAGLYTATITYTATPTF